MILLSSQTCIDSFCKQLLPSLYQPARYIVRHTLLLRSHVQRTKLSRSDWYCSLLVTARWLCQDSSRSLVSKATFYIILYVRILTSKSAPAANAAITKKSGQLHYASISAIASLSVPLVPSGFLRSRLRKLESEPTTSVTSTL